jgi:hypothetical protein
VKPSAVVQFDKVRDAASYDDVVLAYDITSSNCPLLFPAMR